MRPSPAPPQTKYRDGVHGSREQVGERSTHRDIFAHHPGSGIEGQPARGHRDSVEGTKRGKGRKQHRDETFAVCHALRPFHVFQFSSIRHAFRRSWDATQARSKSSTSASSVASSFSVASLLTPAPSPCLSCVPFSFAAPFATCNQACRPAGRSMGRLSPGASLVTSSLASALIFTEPFSPVGEAIKRH